MEVRLPPQSYWIQYIIIEETHTESFCIQTQKSFSLKEINVILYFADVKPACHLTEETHYPCIYI